MNVFALGQRPARRRRPTALAIGVVLVLLGGVFVAFGITGQSGTAVGPHYPDLVAKPPTDLYFSREILADGVPHHLLRFTTIAWNPGDGRLELEGSPNPANQLASDVLFQNIYDATTGGRQVEQRRVGSNLVYHPNHFHYHLDGFAAYQLLQRDADGDYLPTRHVGAKMSSCVLDSLRVEKTGPTQAGYPGCENTRQGMSVGWGDSYHAALPDQWIDLGANPLPDGDYAVRYTVDPDNKIAEGGREDNNVAAAPFSVRAGRIINLPEPARCAVARPTGRVGAVMSLTCSHFVGTEQVRVYWGGRDAWGITPSVPLASGRATGDTGRPIAFTVTIPPVAGGSHNLVIEGSASRRTTVVIVGVIPTISVRPSDLVGLQYVSLGGFGANEPVTLSWDRAIGFRPLTLVTRADGSAEATIPAPPANQPARLLATGTASGLRATTVPVLVNR